MSQEIGEAFRGKDIDRTAQLIAHAATGFLAGAVGTGNCGAGAAGQLVGELSGLLYDGATQADIDYQTQKWASRGVDIARISGALAAALAGGDPDDINLGSDLGGTAAANNALSILASTVEEVREQSENIEEIMANDEDCLSGGGDLLCNGGLFGGGAAGGGGGRGLKGSKSTAKLQNQKSLKTTDKQLQSKYKHAKDFDIKGNYNKANAEKFKNALQSHISNTKSIKGTYRKNQKVLHNYDSKTGINVIRDRSGNYITSFKPSSKQIEHLLKSGSLGGG